MILELQISVTLSELFCLQSFLIVTAGNNNNNNNNNNNSNNNNNK